jgi:hypothetical protein
MFIVLRIILTALWLIITNLLFYDFQLGGRYLILMEAIAAGFISDWIRSFIGNTMDYRVRSMISAGGIIPAFGLPRLIFSGIKLTIPGLVFVYFGLVLMEMIIPEEAPGLRAKIEN